MTTKKNVRIGTHEDSDIIINHPDFHGKEITLGKGSSKNTLSKGKKIPHLISRYKYQTEGLTVHLFDLQVIFITVLIGVAATLSIGIPMAARGTLQSSQDWTPIVLPTQNSYGYFRHDKKHTRGVRFIFEAQRNLSHHLYFILGGSGDGTSVLLTLNGVPINEPLILPKGWSRQTSITLPSEHIRKGENTIEVLPANPVNKKPRWGISEVKVAPANQPYLQTQDNSDYTRELILSALKQPDLTGEELGQYYKIVYQWQASKTLPDAHLNNNVILKQIERKMENILYQVAFDIKSKEILDDDVSAHKLRENTNKWIPESWIKGRKIYNELYR